MTKQLPLLTTLWPTLTDRPIASLEVMVGSASGRPASSFWFLEDGPGGVEKMIVGRAQGEDAERGVYNWWPVFIGDEMVAELRDGASGYVLAASNA